MTAHTSAKGGSSPQLVGCLFSDDKQLKRCRETLNEKN